MRPWDSAASCPLVPYGHNSWLDIVAVSPAGDTLRHARVHLTGTLWQRGSVRPAAPIDSTSATGLFAIGPLAVGEYHLTVEAPNRHPATQKLMLCRDYSLVLRAVLVRHAAPAS